MYTVKSYDNNNLFKVIKMPFRSADSSVPPKPKKEPVHYEKKLRQSLSRARSTVRDLILSNEWDYFVTLTFDRKRVHDRYSLVSLLSEIRPFLYELGRNKKFRYVLVPELHEDGALHFHGVVSGIETAEFPPYVPKKLLDKGYVNWPLWANKFGFASCGAIKSPIGVGFYVSKYITKGISETFVEVGQHTYFHSRGLKKPYTVGWSYDRSDFFERKLTSQYDYCSVGYFRSEYEIVGALLEDLKVYRDYYLFDDASGDLVAMVGGDLSDADFVAGLDQMAIDGVFAVPVECFPSG